tara:strand:- start:19 stop:393 length:375 start_codon:yes stop_codon:yes gene_type:complete
MNRRITPITELDLDERMEQKSTNNLEEYQTTQVKQIQGQNKETNVSHINVDDTPNVKIKTDEDFENIARKIKVIYEYAAYLKHHDKDAYKTAGNFFEHDNTVFYIVIAILVIICLLLFKKSMDM